MSNKKKILLLFTVLITLVLIDTMGFMMIEGVHFFDALYMTVISITTVGYREVFPLGTMGRIFTIWVILSGLGIFFYIAGKLAESTFEGNIRRILGRRKMKQFLNMKDHIIIAGFGRMGESVCRELFKRKTKFILLETNSERFAKAEEIGYDVIMGDATSEESLRLTSIDKARAFISLLSSDADNIYTVMAIREINPSVFIISRAIETPNEKRLYKVGANQVISPYELGSRRIVNTVFRPNVVDFLDVMTFAPEISLSIEEIQITSNSPFLGKIIRESGLREGYNIIVLAVKRNGEMLFNPPPTHQIIEDDILILVGEKEKLLSLN